MSLLDSLGTFARAFARFCRCRVRGHNVDECGRGLVLTFYRCACCSAVFMEHAEHPGALLRTTERRLVEFESAQREFDALLGSEWA